MSILPRIVVFALLTGLAPVGFAATQAQIDQARVQGLAWLMTHQNGDGSWTGAPGLEVQSTASALDALRNAGIGRGYNYGAAVAWLQNADAPSVDSLSRKITSLKGAGVNVTPDLVRLLSWRSDPFPNASGTKWGAYSQYPMSFPDTPLALSAIRLAQYTYTNKTTDLLYGVFCQILPAQGADHGWAYTLPATNSPANALTSVILPTAYTVMELQAIKTANPSWDSNGCGVSYSLTTAINNGIAFLLTKKNPTDNGYGDNGQSSVLETSLVYQALSAVNSADPAKGAALDYLLANQDAAGSWGGDPLQTALMLKSFAPTALADSNGNGTPDAVETVLGMNPVAANRPAAPGNGKSISGITVAKLVAQATLNQAINFDLVSSGGTAPYTWSVTSGNLPDGLSLNAINGQISGTPSTLGTFNFTFKVQDASYASSSVTAQIVVTEPQGVQDTDVPTLPEWGAILMALLLMGSMTIMDRRRRNS